MFQTMDPKQLPQNVFSLLDDQWTLITAGTSQHANMMTASWGGFGVLWHKNVATIYVRPQRYTFEFLENDPTFSLSFFDASYRPQLSLCGSKSGREVDKAKECGFTLAHTEDDIPYVEEANLVLTCRKLYSQDLDPSRMLDPSFLPKFYEAGDYHRMYIGEITQALMK